MKITLLGLEINPAEVSAIQFIAKDVAINNDELELIKSSPSSRKGLTLGKSDLNIYFILGDGSEELFVIGVSSVFYEKTANRTFEDFVGNLEFHSECISAITHYFNSSAIKAGYPVAIKPTPRVGSKAIDYFENYWFSAAIESLEDAINFSTDDAKKSEYHKDKEALLKQLFEVIDYAKGIDKKFFSLLIKSATQALKVFALSIPETEIDIHKATDELAVSFVEKWILSGLYFPLEDTNGFFNVIEMAG